MARNFSALFRLRPVSAIVATLIIAAWLTVSFVHTGTVSVVIYNQSLARYGGATAELVRDGGWWRLLASQFLHVYLLHALFNAAAILIIGSLLEHITGPLRLAAVLISAGVAGQLIAVGTAPTIVATGASQAAIGISATALVVAAGQRNVPLLSAAAVYLTVQVVLDALFAGHVKLPHLGSFLVGLLYGWYGWYVTKFQSRSKLASVRRPSRS
jgi:membrane associated rhomboid family serine protease